MRWTDANVSSGRQRPPLTSLSAVAVAAGAVALFVSGCGGGAKSPQVANLGSTTTSTSSSATAPPSGGSSSGSAGGSGAGGNFQVAMNVGNAAQGRKFSACMREHGIANFPDPNGQGVIQFGSGMGIDPNSPTFQSAQTACRKLLPNGGQPSPQQQAQMRAQLLKFTQCMRAHGVKDFPDPSNGGLRIQVHPGSDLDPNNPQFRAAQQVCQAYLPGKVGGKLGAIPAGGGKAATTGGGG